MNIDIFDVDGTLALGGMRDYPHQWPTLNERVADIYRHSDASIRWVMTGRAHVHHAVTHAWLARHGIAPNVLLLVGDDKTNDDNAYTYKRPYLELCIGARVRLIDDDPLVGAIAVGMGFEWIDARALR